MVMDQTHYFIIYILYINIYIFLFSHDNKYLYLFDIEITSYTWHFRVITNVSFPEIMR